MQKKNYVQEILDIIHSGLPQAELAEKLSDYHENDLADALTALTPEERQKVYTALGVDTVAEIFSYLDDAEPLTWKSSAIPLLFSTRENCFSVRTRIPCGRSTLSGTALLGNWRSWTRTPSSAVG